MTWQWRALCVLAGLLISLSISKWQARIPNNWNQFQLLEVQMKESAREAEERKQQERLRRELEADQKHYRFTVEMMHLWQTLAIREDEFYRDKWSEGRMINLGTQLVIDLIEQELRQR